MLDEDLRVSGRWYQPRSSRYEVGTVQRSQGELLVTRDDESVAVSAPIHLVDHEAGGNGLEGRFLFPDGSVFESADADGLRRVISNVDWHVPRKNKFHGLTPVGWSVLLLSVILLPYLFWQSYPLAADALARTLPPEMGASLGDEAFEQADAALFEPSNLSGYRQDRISGLFDQVVAAFDERSEIEPRLIFRRSDRMGANALAFPNGTIVILDDLVALAEEDDELLAILAHEYAHLTHLHSMRNIVRSTGLGVLVGLMIGDTATLLEEAAAIGTALLQFSYSREFEIEADEAAAKAMRRMGKDPKALVRVLRRMLKDCGEKCEKTSLLSTHPGLKERLEAVSNGG